MFHDASREWLPLITAADASCECRGAGLSVCVAPAPKGVVRDAGRLAERRGDYVPIIGQPLDTGGPSRVGNPHELPVPMSSFKELFALEVLNSEHIGFLEAETCLLQLEWVCRSAKNHGARLLTISDSKVVVCAVSKGRSSSPRLNRALRKIAALCAAANILMRVLYVPSSHNPADPPSRRWHRLRPLRKRKTPRQAGRWRADLGLLWNIVMAMPTSNSSHESDLHGDSSSDGDSYQLGSLPFPCHTMRTDIMANVLNNLCIESLGPYSQAAGSGV